MDVNRIEAIISIYPNHADAILDGRKTIELRRRIPTLPTGTRLWIYATRPTGAIVGYVTIREVSRARPLTIWRKYRAAAAVDYATFAAYFAGAKEAVAILLATAKRIVPVTVEQLREIRDSFHPPQVVTLLSTAEAKALRKIVSTC